MAYADDLLEQATFLAKRESGKPRQASLRRAISTAYYALFHLLVEEASGRLAPSTPDGLQAQIQRAFSHAKIKHACQAFSGNLPRFSFPVSTPLPADLITVAKAFVALQQARHKADYDLGQAFSRVETHAEVGRAQAAFAAWARVRSLPDANAFLTALLLWRSWLKGQP